MQITVQSELVLFIGGGINKDAGQCHWPVMFTGIDKNSGNAGFQALRCCIMQQIVS
jgi:hypothetical protein